MRIIIIGSKAVSAARLHLVCDKIIASLSGTTEIKSTGEPLVSEYATKRNLDCEIFPSDWKKHGTQAPYLRAEELVDNADRLIAFLAEDDSYTKFVINLANNKGIPTVINYV